MADELRHFALDGFLPACGTRKRPILVVETTSQTTCPACQRRLALGRVNDRRVVGPVQTA